MGVRPPASEAGASDQIPPRPHTASRPTTPGRVVTWEDSNEVVPDPLSPSLPPFERRARKRGGAYTAPRAKSEMSCGVAVSKPTTSSIPWSAGSATEKPFDTMPTATSRASIPDARR